MAIDSPVKHPEITLPVPVLTQTTLPPLPSDDRLKDTLSEFRQQQIPSSIQNTSASDDQSKYSRESSSILNQSQSKLRWLILLPCSMLLFGNFYAYDNPAPLHIPLKEYLGHDHDTYQYEINLLYSVYSLPNLFLPFIAGRMVDRMDPRIVLLMFSVLMSVGQTIFAIGVTSKQFPVMLAGRVLLGLGGETISVIQASITTVWFRNKELAFALGLNLCISRLGTVLNANISPRVEEAMGVPTAIWVGAAACYYSLFCALGLCILLSFYKTQADLFSSFAISSKSSTREITVTPQPASSSLKPLGRPWNYLKKTWHDIRLLPVSFWLVCVASFLMDGTGVPFNSFISDLLTTKWYAGDTVKAGFAMSLPDGMSVFLVPFTGYLVDRFGKRFIILSLCCFAIAAAHTILGLTMVDPIIPLVLLGFSYAFYDVTLWPSISKIVDKHVASLAPQSQRSGELVGTAYGIAISVYNISLSVMPIFAAQVRILSHDFVGLQLFFASTAVLGGFVAIALWFLDRRKITRVAKQLELTEHSTSSKTTTQLEICIQKP